MQWLRSDAKAAYSSEGKPPLNQREMTAAGKQSLPTKQYQAKRALDVSAHIGQHVEVVLPVDELTPAARNIKKRRIWGDGIYTADTDIFAALVHQALLPAKCADPLFRWPTAVAHLRCIIKVQPAQASYSGALRNGMRSRGWSQQNVFDNAYSIARAWAVVRMVRSCFMSSA